MRSTCRRVAAAAAGGIFRWPDKSSMAVPVARSEKERTAAEAVIIFPGKKAVKVAAVFSVLCFLVFNICGDGSLASVIVFTHRG